MKAFNLLKTPLFFFFSCCAFGLVSLLSAGAQIIDPIDPQLPRDYFALPVADQFVRITSPANHAIFYPPVDIPIFAYAHEETTEAPYTNVEFYCSGTNALGVGFTNDLGRGFCLSTTNTPPRLLPISPVAIRPDPRLASLYCLVWSNAPAGSYALTAVAKGIQLYPLTSKLVTITRTSAPVNITIIGSSTNQNPTDFVSVVATDPIAIAGTNAYWRWPGVTNGPPLWSSWPPVHWGYTTNWGPKDGLFTVKRFGNANSNLTVNYALGGTASNGVDYLTLPGSITIPAGAGYGLIPVVPLDNSLTNLAKTVVLSLLPDTNSPPNYLLGNVWPPGTMPPIVPPVVSPTRAEVLILDYWPRPLPWLLADRAFHFNTNGPDGAWFCIENSSNLIDWIPLVTNQVIQGSVDFIDPNAVSNTAGYYRVVPVTDAVGN